MKNSERDRLLNEILSGGDVTEFRESSLEHGLNSLRRHRQRQRLSRTFAFASLPILLALGMVWNRFAEFHRQRSADPTQTESSVKFITDEELFALFPGRPLALIGKPGEQQLVFLDRIDSEDAPSDLSDISELPPQ